MHRYFTLRVTHRRRIRMSWLSGSLLGVSAAAVAGQSLQTSPDPPYDGGGWTIIQTNVEVRIQPKQGLFTTQGVITLELTDRDESSGPVLLLSTQRTRKGAAAISFKHVESSGASVQILENPRQGRWEQALVRFDSPKPRGSVISVAFECQTNGPVRRMAAHESAAMADWINAWLPFPSPGPKQRIALAPGLFRAPGRTVLHLPLGWKGLVDGELLERRESATETVETWETPRGIARGFVAGPYWIETRTVNGLPIRVYVLDESKRQDADALAARLGEAIAAQETVFGPYPISTGYSIVEFPLIPEQSFGAVSEQTHMIVQPPNLDNAHRNIQFFAHEAAHAWWGNLIGTVEPGLKWCSESLAQLGAVIAIERMEGEASRRDFMEFGREGSDPYYSAAGYFALARQGQDLAISTMGTGAGTHALANSKGVWIFQMLRTRVGDAVFSNVLKGVIRDFAGRDISADDLRARFEAAAPSENLDRFFAQWLDRPGAPLINARWHANVDGTGLLLELSQTQKGDPYELALDVAVDLANGETLFSRLTLDARSHVFELATPARPIGVRLDPNRTQLIWRPEYGPPPVGEIVGASMRVPKDLRSAIVGAYRFDGINKDVKVFERDDMVYMQPAGSPAVRLLPGAHGVFRVDGPGGMRVEFDLSQSPAQSFVSIEGGGRERYTARRVPPNGL